MPETRVDEALINDIAAQLDLREPNRAALQSIAYAVWSHYDRHGKERPFEGVVDVATGVGKTFVIAAVIEYFAALGHRHFAIITPGSTILSKTVRNFSAGDSRSLLGGMSIRPEVVTSDTFDSAMVAMQMAEEDTVKLYVFTVQSLTKPTTKQGRRTHEFREALGDGFYSRLASEPDLIVLADEHHTYYGPGFSAAVRDLNPHALIGLTATPHPRTPREQIIYRYPLAAAIADRYVKTPVIVGRRDDRDDDRTKLADGVQLLEMKRKAVQAYAESTGRLPVNPVMLVIAQTINDAEEYADLLQRDDFFDGTLRGRVLVVHSDQPEAALSDLDKIELPQSPVRVVVSVGMLKEGWDVKNVYVIASMRASVSDILTEQTLGRGLRLPFGAYTDIEMLDTLEVLAHESYQALLRRADVLREELVDYRTMQERDDAEGARRVEAVVRPVVRVAGGTTPGDQGQTEIQSTGSEEGEQGGIVISAVAERMKAVEAQLRQMNREIEAPGDMPDVVIPVIRMVPTKVPFSLADVEPHVFEELGRRHAADPDGMLLRTVLSAEVSSSDPRSVHLVTRAARDRVAAVNESIPLEDSVAALRRELANAEDVPARGREVNFLNNLTEAYVRGLAGKAADVLTAYPQRAVASFRMVLREEQKKYQARPHFEEVLQKQPLPRKRPARSETTKNTAGRFRRGVGYEGWKRSYYPQVSFDSEPELRFAQIVDDADHVSFWVRLARGDMPIMFTSSENHYHPDFLVVLNDGTNILVEVKGAAFVKDEAVQQKREAARRWARHATAEMGGQWEYILVTDADIKASRASWPAIRAVAH